MQQRHHVKQSLVVALQSIGRRRVPKFFDKFFRARIGGGEACDCIDRNQSLRVAGFQLLSIEREYVAVVRSL